MKKKEEGRAAPPPPTLPDDTHSCDSCLEATWAQRQLPQRPLDCCHVPSSHGTQAGWNVGRDTVGRQVCE